MFPFKEAVEIERLRQPALLTLDQRSTKRSQLGLMFLKQTQAGADHLARGAIATLRNLEVNKVAKMLAHAAAAARGQRAQDPTKLQTLKQEAERDPARRRARDGEGTGSEGRAHQRTGRAGRAEEGELGALRDQLARLQAAIAERDRLGRQLLDLENQVEKERRGAAARVAGLESELAEARMAERAVLARADRVKGEAGALREQLARLTAALRDSRAGTAGRRGG